ncbi:exonuclease SbcC [Actinoplanes sp. ATCC 53533]|uniref:AAA family ATPase n=1 Tax=Actinoplanes sp. ATCC 53533 TaxID=1288362 RepID=UPI000F76E432|nr:SMC family ATPase [Actinoplanes sp. ATCC 53533]RSM41930.1 exonuclease SbcC [Actinoplanes sp. ATCC 53533]
MRPVLLEMTGFGSFREAATVDFAQADFFALVGPTGAGKSTVIDAMVFALYGSVPRWDDRRTVSLALAPTVNRGVVRLVFDVGVHRYVAARELRRSPAGVSIRNGRLERLMDPTRLGTVDDETELIAADGKVNGAVEDLLGLSFGNFCSCVVLPQGDFAEFLHAKPSERQKILTRLLGITVYETIGQSANTEAAVAKQRASSLDEQISQLTAFTQEAEDEANQRVQQLGDLRNQVTALLAELADAGAAAENAERTVRRLLEEQASLSALAAPTDLAALSEHLTAARTAADEAEHNLAAAERFDDAARAALQAAPARGPLEQVRRDHAERARLAQRQPDAENDRAEAANALSATTVDYSSATRELSAARDAAEAATSSVTAAKDRVAALGAECVKLGELSTPTGVAEMSGSETSVQTTLAAARQALTDAETMEAAARHELDAAPTRAPLEQAKHDHAELAKILASEPELTRQNEDAKQQVAAAHTAVEEAHQAVARARTARDEAARTDAAAALRPHLVAGLPCPVCEHPVEALPKPLDHELLAAANKYLADAEDRLRRTTRHHTTAVAAEQRAVGALESAATSANGLRQALTGELADERSVDAELSRLDGLNVSLRAAGACLHQARAAYDAANKEAAALEKRLTVARASLNGARDQLVPFGAPAVDGLDLAEAWQTLEAWAATEAATRSDLLTLEIDKASKAEQVSEASSTALANAQAEANRAEVAKMSAALADQEMSLVLRQLQDRISELNASLVDAPVDEAAAAELTRIDHLEAETKAAHEKIQSSRAARDLAATAFDQLRANEQTAWHDLQAARDRLVPLGAPPVRQESLLAAWTDLVGWAGQQAHSRQTERAIAEGSLAAAERHLNGFQGALANRLSQADVVVPQGRPLAETVGAAVAAALERARADARHVQTQRTHRAELVARKAAAEADHEVAHMLAGLLRSNEFPRWLVASALDVLVRDASASLAELTDGQFDLTHEDGEFLVIDHTNADLPRPVKTLSGGETFQASLALALALSAQMTTLAAAGSARLDSIFLDEGFGTLDETTLNTVANTLENLASQGDRMVGVITHVSTLADRVPVKFRVNRDQYGSTVTRDNL